MRLKKTYFFLKHPHPIYRHKFSKQCCCPFYLSLNVITFETILICSTHISSHDAYGSEYGSSLWGSTMEYYKHLISVFFRRLKLVARLFFLFLFWQIKIYINLICFLVMMFNILSFACEQIKNALEFRYTVSWIFCLINSTDLWRVMSFWIGGNYNINN